LRVVAKMLGEVPSPDVGVLHQLRSAGHVA
jgi:hypothetical protein